MSNEQSTRMYKFSDADLTMFSQEIIDCMRRDIDEFEAFNVGESDMDNLQELCDAFEVFPTDDYINSEYQSATEEKDNLVVVMKKIVRNVAIRVEMKWGKSSAKYKSLGIADMSQISDEAFIQRCRMILMFAEEYQSELESEGLTSDIIADMRDTIQNLEDARRNQISKANYRTEKTTERIFKGNELYKYVSRYCEIGKRIWDGVNPAFYNNYVIYSSGSGGSSSGGNSLPAPSNFRYDYADRTVRWNAVSGATSYKLEVSDDNMIWDVMYEGEDTEYFTGEILPDHRYLRIKSRNANGFSSYATFNVVYEYILNGPTNFTHIPALPGFTWTAVPNATDYEVQLRLASATDLDYNLIYFGNDTTLLHGDPVGSYYVRIRAWNNDGLSGWHLLAYNVGV